MLTDMHRMDAGHVGVGQAQQNVKRLGDRGKHHELRISLLVLDHERHYDKTRPGLKHKLQNLWILCFTYTSCVMVY